MNSTTAPAALAAELPGAAHSRQPVAARQYAWLREPLLHFLVIGALLFALDAALVRREGDPLRIVVGDAVDAEAKQAFHSARGRDPDATELKALRQVWLDNEVLYREGIAMGLDKGDTAIRERVIFKALAMVDAGTKRPDFDETVLRNWFEKNHAKYDEPVRYTFQEAVLAGEATESAVRDFVRALNGGAEPAQQAGLRVFKGRPRENLVQSYGEAFAGEMAALAPGSWQALASRDGWRAVRVESVSPAVPAEFATLRNVVLQDWTDAQMSAQRSAAVKALAAKYHIEMPR